MRRPYLFTQRSPLGEGEGALWPTLRAAWDEFHEERQAATGHAQRPCAESLKLDRYG